MAPWPVNLPTNFELHLGQRPTPSPLIKCPVDTKTVGKEGRTLRGPSVSSDHLPRSGSQQRRVETLPDQEGAQGLRGRWWGLGGWGCLCLAVDDQDEAQEPQNRWYNAVLESIAFNTGQRVDCC